MFKSKTYTVKEFLVSVILLIASLILVFSIIAKCSFEESKYYVLGFLVLLFAYAIDRFFYIYQDKKTYYKLTELREFREISYKLMEDLSAVDMKERDMYDRVLRDAIKALKKSDAGTISMLKDDEWLGFVSAQGFDKNILRRIPLNIKDTYIYTSTDGKMDRVIVVDNSGEKSHLYDSDIKSESGKEGISFDGSMVNFDQMKTTIVAPIIYKGKAIGSLNIDSKSKYAFDEEDKKKLEFFAFYISEYIDRYNYNEVHSKLIKYDQMTSVYNRDYFNELHNNLHNKGEVISYVYVTFDIRGLSSINEEYGRRIGDKLVMAFIDIVKKILPDNAIIGRYAGNEFTCLISNVNKELCKTMFKAIEDYIDLNGIIVDNKKMHIKFDYGMSIYPNNSTDIDEIIVIAEQDRKQNKLYDKSLEENPF